VEEGKKYGPAATGPACRQPERGWPGLGMATSAAAAIWILTTPISSVGHSISSVTFDIEDFDIECSFDIDVLQKFAPSISYVDIEGVRYQRSHYSISKVTNIRY
jgi:hypothetical protein